MRSQNVGKYSFYSAALHETKQHYHYKIYFRCNNATFATVADNQPVTRGIMVAKVAKYK